MQIHSIYLKGVYVYLIDSGTHRLLIDSGFPGMTHELGREIRNTGFKIRGIDYLIVTHFHVDHAGAVQELKEEGVKFVLFDVQVDHIAPMEKMMEGKWPYRKLIQKDNMILKTDQSGTFLLNLGIHGQVISTPGHSDDSITLLLDSGEAFTGDLMAANLVTDENSKEYQSWSGLKNLGAKTIYPSHGKMYSITT